MDISRFADGLPSLAAAFIDSDAIDTGVAGRPSLDERFQIGSNAKAMTATLAAVAVERGLLEWTTPAAEVLDVEGSRQITLERLLAHAGGISGRSSTTKSWPRPRPRQTSRRGTGQSAMNARPVGRPSRLRRAGT